jgi:hypothetical protein
MLVISQMLLAVFLYLWQFHSINMYGWIVQVLKNAIPIQSAGNATVQFLKHIVPFSQHVCKYLQFPKILLKCAFKNISVHFWNQSIFENIFLMELPLDKLANLSDLHLRLITKGCNFKKWENHLFSYEQTML